jgi:glycosyltransferase involved in cell wall biosynthesis
LLFCDLIDNRTPNASSEPDRLIKRAELHDREMNTFLMLVMSDDGGLADYAHAQAVELAKRDVRLIVACGQGFAETRFHDGYQVSQVFFGAPSKIRPLKLRRLMYGAVLVLNELIASATIVRFRPQVVLRDGFREYLSPLWSWAHSLAKRLTGACFAVVIHDPVRLNNFGPDWLHRASIAHAYRPLDLGLIHLRTPETDAAIASHLKLVIVPHGVFPVRLENCDTSEARRTFGISGSDLVLISLGYIADRKNLDLAIKTLPHFPRVHLLVAGTMASARDRSVRFYRELAESLGVTSRLTIVERFIEPQELATLCAVADIFLITYSRSFVSQSGILHLAANWDKPVLASSGPGPLTETVQKYRLGLTVAPDSVEELANGLARLLAGEGRPLGWERFRREASWATNIDRFLAALEL